MKVSIDKEKIIARIEDIKNAVLELHRFRSMDWEEFLENKDNFHLACYWLRIAIEAVLTIGIHILSRLPSNGKKKDYTQVVLSMADYGVLPEDFAQKIKGMAGYRNRLVHLYWKVGPEEIFKIIKQDLQDFNVFVKHIEKFLERNKND